MGDTGLSQLGDQILVWSDLDMIVPKSLVCVNDLFCRFGKSQSEVNSWLYA